MGQSAVAPGAAWATACSECQMDESNVGFADPRSHWDVCSTVCQESPCARVPETLCIGFGEADDDGREFLEDTAPPLPPLDVPRRLAYVMEPGAPLGPPRGDDECSTAASPSAGGVFERCVSARCCEEPSNRVVIEPAPSERQEDNGDDYSSSRLLKLPVVAQLLEIFTSSVSSGVAVALAVDGIGILLIEVRLRVPQLELRLKFELVERCIPLSTVEGVEVTRHCLNGVDTGSGAWLVRLSVSQQQTVCFVFDGDQRGQQEAHYMGGCLRLLWKRALCMQRLKLASASTSMPMRASQFTARMVALRDERQGVLGHAAAAAWQDVYCHV